MKFKTIDSRISAWAAIAIALLLAVTVSACGNSAGKGKGEPSGGEAENPTMEELATLAQKEGAVISIGMADDWANFKDTWDQLKDKYGLKHSDTDMSSAEEIAKFAAEKNNPTSDIGDIGIAVGSVAIEKGVTQPYKTEFWDEIPDWAKDKDGHWIVGYTGTIAFICNKDLVSKCPKSWADILSGDYQVNIGDVVKASQAQHVVLAAAFAFGGDEKNIQPGLDYFAELAKLGKLSKSDMSAATIEKGEVKVALVWDFKAVGYRKGFKNPERYELSIPSEGSVTSGYATIINKWAPHPHAAKLARAYILSDQGQINLAKGFARPIRKSVKIPEEIEAKLIPNEQYANVRTISDFNAWENTTKELGVQWQEQVLAKIR